MIIAVDFDGTCVTHEYPEVGRDIGAQDVLRKLVVEGHKLVLFTMRSGGGLADAVEWFARNDIPLFGINTNPEQGAWTQSPKAYAQLYIDDAALGIPLITKSTDRRPYVDWEKVYGLLHSTGVLV